MSLVDRNLFFIQLLQWTTLVSVGLTCRAWLDICAPRLYERVFVASPRVLEFASDLSESASRISHHTKRLLVRGPHTWRAIPQLLKLLPHVRELDIYSSPWRDKRDIADACHPSHLRVMSGILLTCQTSPRVTELCLADQRFASPADILRLLASFPLLQRAYIWRCTVRRGSENCSVPSSTHLAYVNVDDKSLLPTARTAGLSFLAHWWRWPHLASDDDIGLYPGIHTQDTGTVCAALHNLGSARAFVDTR